LLTEIMAGGKTSPAQAIPAEKVFDLVGRERELIRRVLKECGWNQSRAAIQLSITRNTLRYRMKKYGIRKQP
ncbi:helix-turn-helix domain-containing protein, partial [Desulfobacterota bacterium M19]